EGEMAEPLFGDGPLAGVRRVHRGLGVELVRALDVVEAQRDLGLERGEVLGLRLLARGEVVLGHAEAPAELPEELERGDPVARLDPRDIRRRAARERELALAQPGRDT